MSQFSSGKILRTLYGVPIKIVKHLGRGGQGDVYIVEYKGQRKALKWYHTLGKNPRAFYENVKRNTEMPSPDKAFLWPEAVTEKTEGSFGYIMDLRPDGYYELSEFMLAKVTFASFKVATDACLKIVSAFRALHNKGLSYQDLNDGNFFIHPQTGDVLICDNDNVAPHGTNTGIIGKPRYMAPEIVVGKSMPNKQTDRFSLAIILFLILFMNHPLEGRHALVPCMTDEIAERLYGSEALFIYDAMNKGNSPVKNIHSNVVSRWGCMPSYIKDVFMNAFSQTAIKDANRRPTELDWLMMLTRFRSDVTKCTCGGELCILNAATTKCDECGRTYVVKHTLRLPDYTIAAIDGTRIYRCQLGYCGEYEALNPVAAVVAKRDDPSILGVMNATPNTLAATTTTGATRYVKPREVVPLLPGIVIEAYGTKIIFG